MSYQTQTINFMKAEFIEILGVKIDRVTMKEALILMEKYISLNEKSHIIPINPELIMQAQKNKKFKDVLNNARLRLADGIGVVIASKLMRKPLTERVAGVDTVYELANIAAKNGWSIYFLGAAPGVAEKTASKLLEKYPNLKIAGAYAGSPNPKEEKDICDKINRTNADILLVAYGSPNQDLWIARNLNYLNVKLAMGVGGTFDFIAGIAKRAPLWIRKIGLEWLYRLIREPYRWKRMLALPKFAFRVTYKFLTDLK